MLAVKTTLLNYCSNYYKKLKIMAVLKVIEVMSSSEKSWEDAAKNAVKIASKTVKEIRSVYVQDMSAVVNKNLITEFRVTVKITFEVMAG